MDCTTVKLAANGRWPELLERVGGIPANVLDGNHHPCPKCGGTDRFRFINSEAGAVLCNKCFAKGNGDGIAAIQWAADIEFKEALDRVSQHLGLNGYTRENVFQGIQNPEAENVQHVGQSTIAATYDYRDADGSLLFQVVRLEPKSFRQRKPKPGGGWDWSVKGCKVVPYRLPEILESEAEETVFIVEGEKDADYLANLDLQGTCSAGGAGKWRPELAGCLQGRKVAILPDNDEPGRKHAQQVAKSLLGKAASIKVVALPGLPEKGDVSDWIDNHGDAAEPQVIAENLMALVDATKPFDQTKQCEQLLEDFGPIPEPTRKPIQKLTLGELLENHSVMKPPVIDGLIRQGETGNYVASSKVGKSWGMYGLAYAVASGQPWLGIYPTAKGRVLLIDNELHAPTLATRLRVVGEAMDIFPADHFDDIHFWPLRGNLRSLNELADEFDDVEPGFYKLIIFDARYRFAVDGESENDNAAQTRFFNQLDQLAAKTDSALMLVHHSTKGSQTDKKVTDVGAGAGAQSRAADCHLVLREHEEEGVMVLDAAVRSFKPIQPLALRWNFPLWVPDEAKDATKLKGKLSGQEQKQKERDTEGKGQIVTALLEGPATARQLRKATGISKDRMQRLLDLLESQDQITSHETIVKGNPCSEYKLTEMDVVD